MAKEYRVVATDQKGVFRVFGPNLTAALSFSEIGSKGGNFDPQTPRRLEWRDDANQGDDSTWQPYAV